MKRLTTKLCALFSLLVWVTWLVACGSDSGGSSVPGAGVGGTGAVAGTGANAGVGASAGLDEPPFADPGADAPPLELPADITALAQSVVDATTLDEAIAATQKVLARGGVSTVRDDTVLSPGDAPASTLSVPSIVLADMALEAMQRRDVATLTGSDLANLFHAVGWPVPEGKSPREGFMGFLSAWTRAALVSPEEPTSFAILFIAASNQLQKPRANLSLAEQDLDFVRFSLLELELLSAAFARVSAPLDPQPLAGSATACGEIKKHLGILDQGAKIGMSEAFGQWKTAVVEALEETFGSQAANLGKGFFKALDVVKVGTKLWKVVQYFRYGKLALSIDTPNPTKKPRKTSGKKFGKLTARAGVDQKAYDDYKKWLSHETQKTLSQISDCFAYLGLPQKTDINDVAKDAANWRVSWNIEKGSGTEVLFKEGQKFKIVSRLENQLAKGSDTEATNSVEFEILPQLNDIDTGTERKRHAVFSAQLRRGNAPDLVTAWGSGKSGYKAWKGDALGAVLGASSAIMDTVGNFALEVASPKRYVTQELIEIVPKGWVGTIVITEQGHQAEYSENTMSPKTWTSWVGGFRFETVMTLGGSEALSPSVAAGVEGIGRSASRCDFDFSDASGAENTCEGCNYGPSDHSLIRNNATWSRSVPLGEDGTAVIFTAYPEDVFGPLKASLPPEIQAKIGSFELLIAPPGCGQDQGLTSNYTSKSTYLNGWITNETYNIEPFPVDHLWTGPWPDMQPALLVTGKLDADGQARVIQRSLSLESTREVITTHKVPSMLTVQIDLRRVD
ncbi:MAG: hypothetical protein R3B13_05545 [Polyangiaceae bacterium]